MVKLAIAADHGGFELKEKLVSSFAEKGIELKDLGTYSVEACDYPDLAQKMCAGINDKEIDTGILICGSGIGISIAANRCKGIRAAILYNDEVAHLAREHNNANVAVFGARMMDYDDVIRRLEVFLNTDFEGGRHQNRIEKIEKVRG